MEKDKPEVNGADEAGGYKSVLGLSGEPGEQVVRRGGPVQRGTPSGTIFPQLEPEEMLELTVIVPARNE